MRAVTITPSTLTHLVEVASSRGATYADARAVEREHEAVSVKDGAVESVTRTADRGLGFRVVHKGAWGFPATDRTDEAAIRGLVDEAFRRAEASASVQRRTVTLAPVASQRGEYRTKLARDPFAVPLAERIDHLRAVDAASATLDAPLADERPTTLVFAPEFLALLVHESCGHPTEADRLLEHEVAFAGTTFMWPEDRGKLRYGSPHVSMTADATVPGGMGTFGWDDDGVQAMRTKLVDKGIFVGYLTSRETAGALGLPVAIGSARAEGWQHFPIVRMVNVSLDPGTTPYYDLLRGVESGLLMEAPASYSLDDKRQNFHFSTQSARVIRNGQLEGYVRGVAFQSLTPDFWGRCDDVADDWELHGFLSCAKGEPLQLMRVGHGAAHARFRDVPIEVRE